MRYLTINTTILAVIALNFACFLILTGSKSIAYGLDRLCYQNGMVHGLLDIDQRSVHYSDGRLYGLKDQAGRTILPPVYSDIEYCRHEIFLATEVQKANRYYFGERRHFFNREGVESEFKLPADAYLLNVFSFGAKADLDRNVVLDKLPTDAILLVGYTGTPLHQQTKQALCNLNGKLLLSPHEGSVLFLEPGKALIEDAKRSIVDLQTWESTPTSLSYMPGSVPKPRIPFPRHKRFPPDRDKIEVNPDDGSFDHDYWCERYTRIIDCDRQFSRFLLQHNLVGMSRRELKALLGCSLCNGYHSSSTEDVISYRFPQYSCVGYYRGVRVYLTNDVVSSWSFIRCEMSGEPVQESSRITQNVVVKDLRRHIGENTATAEFPEVVRKDVEN